MIVGESFHVSGQDPINARVAGSTGWRLWRMALLHTPLTEDDYHEVFDRRNLCGTRWDDGVARREAGVIHEFSEPGQLIVVLGRKVQESFGHPSVTPLVVDEVTYYMIPHPSGLNRWYNDPSNRSTVGKLIAELYLKYRRSE